MVAVKLLLQFVVTVSSYLMWKKLVEVCMSYAGMLLW